MAVTVGDLVTEPALDRPDLVADAVWAALQTWSRGSEVAVVEIDPDLADTAAMTAAYGISLMASANCVVIGGKRGGEERVAGCVIRADTRADVNNVVRRRLDVRKASFLATDRAVSATGMEYGGITPLGLPAGWPILVDARVAGIAVAVIGSGLRRSKLLLTGADLAQLPGAEITEGLAVALGPPPEQRDGDAPPRQP